MLVSLLCRPFDLPGGLAPDRLVIAAQSAEAAGLYGLHFGEHVVMGSSTDAYPRSGGYEHDLDAAWPEPLMTLAALAVCTSRIRLSTGVLLTPLRPAVLVAKSLATLDVLAAGRTEPGLGVGWQQAEYVAMGIPWEERYRRFSDTIRVCRALWEHDQPTSLHTDTVTLDGIYSQPRPVQQRLPLLFGFAMTPARGRQIAQLGDGWCASNIGLDAFRSGVIQLHRAWDAADRPRSELKVRVTVPTVFGVDSVMNVERTIDEAHKFVEAGATIVAMAIPRGLPSMSAVEDLIARIGAVAAQA